MARWTFDTDARDEIGSSRDHSGKRGVARGRLRPVKARNSQSVHSALSRDIARRPWKPGLVRESPEKPVTVLEIKNQSGYRGRRLDGIHYAAANKKQWENASTAQFRTADTGGSKESGSDGELIR